MRTTLAELTGPSVWMLLLKAPLGKETHKGAVRTSTPVLATLVPIVVLHYNFHLVLSKVFNLLNTAC